MVLVRLSQPAVLMATTRNCERTGECSKLYLTLYTSSDNRETVVNVSWGWTAGQTYHSTCQHLNDTMAFSASKNILIYNEPEHQYSRSCYTVDAGYEASSIICSVRKSSYACSQDGILPYCEWSYSIGPLRLYYRAYTPIGPESRGDRKSGTKDFRIEYL